MPPPPALESRRVLVVDDDEIILAVMESLLIGMNYTCRLALSGEKALETLAGGFEPCMVIMDMDMPGLGGAGTLPLLRKRLPEIPVLICTGRVDGEVQTLLGQDPNLRIMAKPFGMEDLQIHLKALAG